MHLKRVRRCLVVWRHLRVSCSVDALKMQGCKTHFEWKFPLKTRFQRMLRSCLATFYYKALWRSHMVCATAPRARAPRARGRLCFKLSTTRARALARALDKPGTARARVEEMQVMTFDSCVNCRKAMAGPSPQLFRAMLSCAHWKNLLQGFNNARALCRAHWTNLRPCDRELRRCKS